MELTTDRSANDSNQLKPFLLICLFACVPVYWAALFYIEIVTGQEIEELAIAVAIGFFLFFYIGWSLPKQWMQYNKRVLEYIRFLLLLFIIASIIWLFVHADIQLRRKPAINLLLFWGPFILMASAIGAFVNLFRRMAQEQLRQANITVEQSRSELYMLQSQMSPHFLFNTLNNLYGLSITQHQQIPPLLLKLSDLLRYSVYEAKELFVPLKEELAYIHNYIDFEKIRIGDRLSLTTSIESITDDEIKIAPMLLIVFIENAFKHAKNTIDEKIFITIELKRWSDHVLFAIKNSHSGKAETQQAIKTKGGLGLENVRKRLQLLYPGGYDLKINDQDGWYTVQLQLKVK
jgi:sensor histidine kinase YesM